MIYKCKIEITVLIEALTQDMVEHVINRSDLSGIAYEIVDGDWAGKWELKGIDQMRPHEVKPELDRMGVSETFFEEREREEGE